MVDTLSSPERSARMRSVPSRHTAPELAVRKAAHALGLRFRLHRCDLPGTPDLVFPKHRTAMFVHGCFWHRHDGCRKTTTPKTRVDFWAEKFARNQQRDELNIAKLRDLGWRVVVIWECETLRPTETAIALARAFGEDGVVDWQANGLPPQTFPTSVRRPTVRNVIQ